MWKRRKYELAEVCNTVVRGGGFRDPRVGHAGSIEVYLKSDCAGRFRIIGSFFGELAGVGPQSKPYAALRAYNANGARISEALIRVTSPIASHLGAFVEDVTLSRNQEKLVFRYEPELRLENRSFHGGIPAYVRVDAFVSVSSVTEVK